MRLFWILVIGLILSAPSVGHATPAQAFRGLYRLISADGSPISPKMEYLLVDADTLEVIWSKYASGDLPPDLEQFRNEPAIIAGFTDRDFVILSFEAFSMVTDRYMRLQGGQEMRFELFRQDDGNYRVGTIKNGINNRYLVETPLDLPSSRRKYQLQSFQNFLVQKASKLHYK